MSEELKDFQTAPTLTLNPFAEEEKAQPEVKKEEPLMDENVLSEEERKMADQFANQIDLTNSAMILQYGAGTQSKMADFSETALENVKTKDLGEVGELLGNVVKELKNFDEEEEKGFFGIFKKQANKIQALKTKYAKAETNINQICQALEGHQVQLMKDVAILDKMYELNLTYFKELTMYILAVTSLRLNAGKLDAVFDTNKVAAVLEKYGAQAWQGLADPIIVWMYESGNGSGSFVGGELTAFAKAFAGSADNNKYRLMFPLLDLEDIQSVTYDTMATADSGALVAASKRYGSDFVIACVVDHLADGNISISCKLLDKDGKILYEYAGVGAADSLADNQAKAIAGVLSSLQQGNMLTAAAIADPDTLGAHGDFVRLKLYGINNLNDLVAFERVLSGIGVEGNVSCAMVSDSDAIIVNVYTQLDPASLDGSLEHSSEFSK